MTAGSAQSSDEPYSPQELEAIARALGVPGLSDEITNQLQAAAFHYSVMSLTEPGKQKPKARIRWPTRAEQRNALKAVAEASRQLQEALGKPALRALDNDLRPTFDTQHLEELAKTAERALDTVPPTGAEPKLARLPFVRVLGEIYANVTGKRPTLSRNLEGRPSGKFYEFVAAELSILSCAESLSVTTTSAMRSVVRLVTRIS